ncbi:NADPH-dependent F420 reductase [Subtercola endophyticus]|uniref:NADPH-dependent F420 reductase n=1 Tax=Subtercola endophyticus TaxID=2895559 RepID=UPI001E29E28B|nr:NAD(P)-binding domain-containing protein [Subtercola endophyticus]UFS57654.1 NAD(P)-binding domain-containing protein [Subtercola endophyticus]
MNIALLGTGHVATLLAAAWATAGHTVTFGSRDPEAKAAQLDFPVTTIAEAVAGADVVVNATPGAQSVEILTAIGADAYAGKVVLDVANAATASLDLVYPDSSLGQALQEALPQAKVVKSLNTAAMNVIVNPSSIGESSLFVSGDHDDAKNTVKALIVDLGWKADDIVDLGGIDTAKGAEYYFQLFFAIMNAVKNPQFNIKLVR